MSCRLQIFKEEVIYTGVFQMSRALPHFCHVRYRHVATDTNFNFQNNIFPINTLKSTALPIHETIV